MMCMMSKVVGFIIDVIRARAIPSMYYPALYPPIWPPIRSTHASHFHYENLYSGFFGINY